MTNQLENITNLLGNSSKIVSGFHEWKSVDHSFEEIRVLLHNSQTELKKQGLENETIERILRDGKVDGSELHIANEAKLKDSFLAFYISDDKIIPQNISLKVKDGGIIDDRPFVLPLLFEKVNSNIITLVVNEGECKAYSLGTSSSNELHFDRMPTDLTETLNKYLVSDKLDFDLRDDELDRSNLELSEASLDDKRKKMAKQALAAISPALQANTKLIVMASNRLISHIRHDVELHSNSSKGAIDIVEFTPSGANDTERKDSLLKKVSAMTANNLEKESPLPKFNRQPIYDLNKALSVVMLGQAENLYFDEGMLRHHLETFSQKDELLKLNGWLLDNMKTVANVQTAPNMDGPIAVTPFSGVKVNDLQQSGMPQDQKVITTIEKLWSSYMGTSH